MAAGDTYELGAGTLQVGATGSAIDASCLVNNLKVTASKGQGDSSTKLCGTVKTPKPTYTYSLSGNIDQDLTDPDGLWALSQIAPGTDVPFTFVPSTDAGTEAAGVATLDPMDFGGDKVGAIMASDIEWSLTGQPEYTIAGEVINPAATTLEDQDQDEDELDEAV